jgi:hypothetical protein
MLPLAIGLAANSVTPSTTSRSHVSNTGSTSAQVAFQEPCTNPYFPSESPTAMDTASCGLAGNGGAETNQNTAKNNFCASGPGGDLANPTPVTIPELIDLQAKVQQIPDINFGNPRGHPLTSKPGPVTDRRPLTALGEGSLVELTGYVKIARQEGAESVNCGSNVPNQPVYHDIHISIVPNQGDAECSGVVAEMTPHHRPDSWTAALVNEVAAAGLLVRATGQRMFDSSHTPCQNGTPVKGDPSRSSLWEVHPIYKFEVCPQGNCTTGGWVPLEEWTKGVENTE